jgi:hypothetical protein
MNLNYYLHYKQVMNSKLFCSAVMFVIFICIVANFGNNKGTANKLISLFLLLAVIASILSSSKSESNLENFVASAEDEEKRIKALNQALEERIESRDRLKISSDLSCNDRRIVSLGAGYHPLQDVPACVDGESMLHFTKSVCKPECCDFGKNNGFSCSTGCVCKN